VTRDTPEDNQNAFGERIGAADLADSVADRGVKTHDRTMGNTNPVDD
jgi:hypothetical protein